MKKEKTTIVIPWNFGTIKGQCRLQCQQSVHNFTSDCVTLECHWPHAFPVVLTLSLQTPVRQTLCIHNHVNDISYRLYVQQAPSPPAVPLSPSGFSLLVLLAIKALDVILIDSYCWDSGGHRGGWGAEVGWLWVCLRGEKKGGKGRERCTQKTGKSKDTRERGAEE